MKRSVIVAGAIGLAVGLGAGVAPVAAESKGVGCNVSFVAQNPEVEEASNLGERARSVAHGEAAGPGSPARSGFPNLLDLLRTCG